MSNSTNYKHTDIQGENIDLPVGKAVCVGRNYHDHIKELNNAVPELPIFFMKPSSSIVSAHSPIVIPSDKGECHNEIELSILIKSNVCNASVTEARSAIWGVGLSLDLTLRDEQTRLKKLQQPWERAKAFDGSCPSTGFVPIDNLKEPLDDLSFSLYVNREHRQKSTSALMIVSILKLIVLMSEHFTLLPGDIVLTGTPKGVAPLHSGDSIRMVMDNHFAVDSRVICQ